MAENHNIEDFFRKRLESHEFPFQEDDWLLLESRLGIPGQESAGTFLKNSLRKTIFIAAASLTIAFVLGWLARDLFAPGRSSGRVHQKVSGMKAPDGLPNPVSSHYTDKISLITGKSGDQTATQENLNDLSVEVFREAHHEIPPDFQKDQPAGREGVLPEPAIPLTSSLSAPHLPGLITPILPPSPVEIQIPAVQAKRSFRRRWVVGLIIAPDYNSVKLMHNIKVTALTGGQLAYIITPRWSVSAGILYSNKKYVGEGDYITPPEGYWLKKTNGIIPNEVSGSCRVIDVPIMTTFRFLQREIVSFSASAGIGSYFMLDEKYDFEFMQDNPGAVTHWQTGENTGSWFSIANFALGMEFQTTQRTFLTVEPYMKLPLNQIGWGKINLYSAGLSFTLKYRL